jgi:hypothetical protein
MSASAWPGAAHTGPATLTEAAGQLPGTFPRWTRKEDSSPIGWPVTL